MKRFTGRLEWAGKERLHALPYPELHGGIVVLWRGAIGNWDELIREARSREEDWVWPSEGELFANAYRWWGSGIQGRVRGAYAVAIHEPRTRTLLLARDPMGIVSLFYSVAGDAVSFATHPDDLAETVGTGECRELDPGESLLWRSGRPILGRTPVPAPD